MNLTTNTPETMPCAIMDGMGLAGHITGNYSPAGKRSNKFSSIP
jgi:hypothetical protein